MAVPFYIPVFAANPGPMTGDGNWTYFLPGRHAVLIDAGTGKPAHIADIESASASGPGRVLVSHAHGDHISGVSAIHARWPATVFAKYPWTDRDGNYSVVFERLNDGDTIEAGDGKLQVIHTPGHAPDHVAFWHAESKTVFSGDLVVEGTTVVILASGGGSLAQYLSSLERIRSLAPARLLPAHGRPIDDPSGIIDRYLAHRRGREAQVMDALRAGSSTVDAIVGRIYAGLAAPLVPMARESVLAHLIKLDEEGRARRDGEGWSIE